MTRTVSIPAIQQYLNAAKELGVDTDLILARCNIDHAQLEDNTQRLALVSFEQLLAELIEASSHPYFGLYASQFITPSTYASLGLISISANTLRECIELVPTYEPLVGDMGVTELILLGDTFLQAWHCQLEQPQVRRHVTEAVLSSWFRYGQKMLGLEGELLAVQFQHQAPTTNCSDYHDIFHCPPSFGCEHNGLLMPTEVLDIHLPQANPQLQQSLIQHADQTLQQLQTEQPFMSQVRVEISRRLHQPALDKDSLAKAMNISSRTLQRRLQQHGCSYQQLLSQIRFEQAKLLLQQDVNIDHISQQLGFAETRSFLRAFKQWSGVTTGQYRCHNLP